MAASTTEKSAQNLTLRGRLSWPTFTYAQALVRNSKSEYPKAPEDVRPTFSLLLNEQQADKLITHLKDVFIPWGVEQSKRGEKRSPISPAHAKKLIRILDERDWEADGVLGLIKPVHPKTVELAPEAVLTLAVNGFKGRDLVTKAIVRSVDDLANPHSDVEIPERGVVMPLNATNLELYPGSVVGATINLFAFTAAGNPGITAGTGEVVFIEHADRFGGGGGTDEDELFMDE